MNSDVLKRLPRPLAFVLPGGGALGAYQAGVLTALAASAITPDLLVGVSAGAVNAALFAFDGVAGMDAMWRRLRRRQLLRIHPGRLALAAVGRRSSFVDNRHGRAFLDGHFAGKRIDDAPHRLAIVATDLSNGDAIALTEGDVTSALRASTAFPGVYPPVAREGRFLIDGGVVADIPLDLTADLGARSVVIVQVPPLAPQTPPTQAIDILFRASTLGVEAHGRTTLRRPPGGLEVVEIPAAHTDVTTFSLHLSGTLIDDGRGSAQSWLDEEAAVGSGGARSS